MYIRVLMLALLGVSSASLASALPDYPFVFTSGSAERLIAPDIAQLSFRIQSHQREADTAIAMVESASKRVAGLLEDADVKVEDIDASEIDKVEKKHRESGAQESVPGGFEASRRFKVTIRDLAKYPVLVNDVFELPASEGFFTTFDRTDREQIERQLFDQAAKNAQARAEQMATSFARKLGQVRGIAQVPFMSLPDWLGFSGDSDYGPAAYAIGTPSLSLERLLVPATITISVEVNAVFELQ